MLPGVEDYTIGNLVGCYAHKRPSLSTATGRLVSAVKKVGYTMPAIPGLAILRYLLSNFIG